MLLGVIAIVWTMLTFYVQREGPEAMSSIGESVNNPKALIVYDPDPFYDLDEQVCTSFALGLAEEGWSSKVVSVASTKDLGKETYDLYVFCANTYNWAPDRSVSNYIKDHQNLKEKKNSGHYPWKWFYRTVKTYSGRVDQTKRSKPHGVQNILVDETK